MRNAVEKANPTVSQVFFKLTGTSELTVELVKILVTGTYSQNFGF
jgi:hypothetical protein